MERASRPSSAAKLAEANSATNAVLIWNSRIFKVIGIFLVRYIMGIKIVSPCTFMQKRIWLQSACIKDQNPRVCHFCNNSLHIFANLWFCSQTGSCHSGGLFDPANAKITTACLVLQLLSFNFEPDNANAIKVHSEDISLAGNGALVWWLFPVDVWQLLRRSLVGWMLMYAQSRQIQQHAVVQPFHNLRFKRTTVMSYFPAFERFARKWVKWLSSQMNLSKLAVWKMAFWPVVHVAEFNRRDQRGDGANWWFIDAMITQPASISASHNSITI